MQSSNHFEASPSPYTSVSTSDLHSGRPDHAVSDVQGVSQDYGEAADRSSSAEVPVVTDPRVTGQPAVETAENEQALWEGRTSAKLFLARVAAGVALTIAWAVLAAATWGYGYTNLAFWTYGTGAALLIFWLITSWKMFRNIQRHHYRLTTRRLIIRTGLFNRRLDQVELLRVKDVYVNQSLLQKWIGIGHVMVLSSEQTLPKATLYGIDRPRYVMDLIWLRTRAELDNKTARVERV